MLSSKLSQVLRRFPIPVALFLILLWSCNQENESDSFLNLSKLADSLTRYDSVRVVLINLDGDTLDTVFHGKVKSKEDLSRLPAPHYKGEKVKISIVGYESDRISYQTDRTYDGSKQKTDSLIQYILPSTTVQIAVKDTSITEGDSVLLPSVTVIPENLFDPAFVWSSSDSLTVGLEPLKYYGRKAGSAQLRVKLKSDTTKFAGFEIRVVAKPRGIAPERLQLVPDTLKIAVKGPDKSFTLNAYPTSASRTVIWSLQDSTKATVNASGTVSALKAGLTRIWAISKIDSTISDTAWLNIQEEVKVDSVHFVLSSIKVFLGGSRVNLSVNVSPDLANTDLEWLIRDSSIVTLADHKVEGKKVGSTWIHARSKWYRDKVDSVQVIVLEQQIIDSVEVKPDTLKLYTGGKKGSLLGQVHPKKADSTLLWHSSRPEIVSVNDTGEATPETAGTTFIVAVSKADSSRRDSSLIIVKRDVPILNVGRDTTLAIDQSLEIKPSIKQEFGDIVKFKWDLDNDGVWDDSASEIKSFTKSFPNPKEYRLRFYVQDSEGNDTTVVKTVKAFKGPVPLILTPADGFSTREKSITIAWMINGKTQDTLTAEILKKAGANTITRSVSDSLGNINSTSITVYWDTLPPNVPIATSSQHYQTKTPTWTWKSGGGGGNGQYRLSVDTPIPENAPAQADTFFTALSELSLGLHTLLVQERDAAGNWSASGRFALRIDQERPPAPKVKTTQTSPTNIQKPTWTWSKGGGDGNGTFRFRLDSSDLDRGATQLTDSTFTAPQNLDSGLHTLYVQERDTAGNWSLSGTAVIRLDFNGPSAPKLSVTPVSPTNNVKPTWSWTTGGEGGAGIYRFRLDSSDLSQGAKVGTGTTFTPDIDLVEGTHSLFVQEQDSAGNWSTSGSALIRLDLTPPSAPKPSLAGGLHTSQIPTWTWSSGGNGGIGEYRCKLNDSSFTSGSIPVLGTTYTPKNALPGGLYTLYVQERDSAGNWSQAGEHLPIRVHGQTGYIWSTSGTHKSTSGGATWVELPGVTFTSTFFTDAKTGYGLGASSNGSISKTTNGGAPGWMPYTDASGIPLQSCFFIKENIGYAVSSYGTVMKTINAGATWANSSSGYSLPLNSVYFINADTGFVVGNNNIILKTVNGGTIWEPKASPISSNFTSVYFTNSITGYAVGSGGVILKTIDGGAKWELKSSGVTTNLNSIFFTSAETGFAVGATNSILKTTNGGSSWSPFITSANSGFNSVFFVNPNIGFAVGNSGVIYKTTDGGTGWASQTSGTTNALYSTHFIN